LRRCPLGKRIRLFFQENCPKTASQTPPTLLRHWFDGVRLLARGSFSSRQAGRQRETSHRITILHKLVLGVVLVIDHGKIDLGSELSHFLMMALPR